MRVHHTAALTKNSQFLKLWLNQILLQVSFNMSNYTALLLLADRTHSPFVQAQFYTAITIPAFLFGLIAGPVVDLVDRKRLMLVADFLLALLFLCYVFSQSSIVLVMAIAFLSSSVARFFIPAQAATIPAIVANEHIEQANALFLFTLMGSVIFGYTLAGPVIAIFGGLTKTGIAASFLLSSSMVLLGGVLLATFQKVSLPALRVPKGTFFAKTFYLFLQTVDEVTSNRRIALSLGLLLFVELMVGVMSVVLLEYIYQYLKLPFVSVSYIIMVPFIVGLFIGMLLLKPVERRFGHGLSMLSSCLGVGVLFFTLGFLPVLWQSGGGLVLLRLFAMLFSVISGILIVLIAVQARTILQTAAPISMQGRIFSFLDILIALITPVPVLFLGYAASKVSLLTTLNLLGIFIFAATYLGSKFVQGKSQ